MSCTLISTISQTMHPCARTLTSAQTGTHCVCTTHSHDRPCHSPCLGLHSLCALLLINREAIPATQPHTEASTHKSIHTQKHRHTDTSTHRHIDTHIYRHIDTSTYGHRSIDTQTHRHTDTEASTHRRTDTQTHRHTDL